MGFPYGLGNIVLSPEQVEFVDAINSKSRKPVQLAVFYLEDETFYLSDRSVGTLQGLENQYEPWVESWGTLKDNTYINNLYDGNSLEIRSGTITIIVAPNSRTFVKKLFQLGIENTKVELYQWFEGISHPPLLIDTFVCQDPIVNTESSMLLKIDLVSPLMKTNPYLFPDVPGVESQPVVIGKATGMPLKDLQTARKTALADDLTFDYTGTVFIDNGVGFHASGNVYIDSELISYDWISASGLNITARGVSGTTARPHLRGALILPQGAIYDYAICSGPVDAVDNLLGNGEAYVNDVTFFTGQNPVIARFVGRPPWLKVTPGAGGPDIIPDPETITEYGASTQAIYGNTANAPTSDSLINSASGSASLAISSLVSGGPGSFTKFANIFGTNNLGANDYTKVIGTNNQNNGGLLQTKSGFLGDIVDDALGSIDAKYGWTDTAYGNIISVTVEVPFDIDAYNKIIASETKLRIILIRPGGATTILQEWVEERLSTNWPGVNAAWSNKTFYYDISVANFTELKDIIVRVELENITAKTAAEYNATADRSNVSWKGIKFHVAYFIPAGSVPTPYQELVSHFNRNLSSLGAISNVTAKVYFAATLSNSQTSLEIVRRSTTSRGDNTVLWSSNITSSLAGQERTFDLGSMSWTDLQNLRIGVYQQVTGPTTEGVTRNSTVAFSYVRWTITYQPGAIETPDEEKVVYAETMVCDVTSLMGADPTPPEVLQYLLENHSESGQYVDTVDFQSAHDDYALESYFLNGVLPAGIRLHDALKNVLHEGMCRFIFSQGMIRLITYFTEASEVVNYNVSLDDLQLRSRRSENQPIANINNDVTVLYNKDYYLDVYNDKINVVNDESVVKYGRRDVRRELKLINSESVATAFAERLLSILSVPTGIYSFKLFMKAYVIEKGDKVKIQTFLDPRFSSVGQVLSVEREFGQGKNRKINLFKISIANPRSYAVLDLEEFITISDNNLDILKGLVLPTESVIIDDSGFDYGREFILRERIQMVENLYLDICEFTGYGACGYGIKPYGD